jgi:NAD(P)-dependent dehydrogenase (short-subunit alcohol dehydrogenase family)
MSVQGRTVLITGGGGGLGCEVTAQFVRDGADVTVPVIEGDESRLCGHLGDDVLGKVHRVPVDLTDEAKVRSMFEGFERLDIVVHLVGGFAMGPIHEVDLATYRHLVDLNLTTTVLVLKYAVAKMREAGYGRIVTVASKSAEEPTANMGLYAATKAGVLALTRAVADECKGTGVTANCILPTIIDTPANRAAMGEANADKWVTPKSLAQTIEFLASEAAGDLRGTATRVFGSV